MEATVTRDDLIIHESPAVLKHLEILQGIITRMAGNSAACKTWSLTIITGIIALSVEKCCIPIWISLIPTIMFFALDSFYLGLERHFIGLQRDFVSKLAAKTLEAKDIYVIKSKRNFWIHLKFMLGGMVSFSTAFIYVPIILLVIYLWKLGF